MSFTYLCTLLSPLGSLILGSVTQDQLVTENRKFSLVLVAPDLCPWSLISAAERSRVVSSRKAFSLCEMFNLGMT